jgi:hypothetical protein
MKLSLFFLLILFAIPINAYQIKYYGHQDFKPNISFIKEIPSNYFIGVKFIRFHEECSTVRFDTQMLASYWHGLIDIYGCGDSKSSLIHELAHHQQYLHRQDIYRHNSIFYGYEKNITDSSY